MNRLNKIGCTIKKLRILKGINQVIIADQLGISERLFGQIENGEKSPKVEILEQIAEIFNMNFEDLILFNEDLIFNKSTNKITNGHDLDYMQETIRLYELLVNEKNQLLLEKNQRINTLEMMINYLQQQVSQKSDSMNA